MANQPTKYSKFLVGAASAALVASAVAPVASAADFTDSKAFGDHASAIEALVDLGVVKGYPDGSFKPNQELTRNNVVKFLGKWLVAQGYEIPADAVSNPRFVDLKSTSEKETLEYAAVVKDNGVFVGSNGNLMGSNKMTREDMAVVIVRALNTVNGIDLDTYVAGQDFKRDVKDLNTAYASKKSAIDVFDFFDITNPAVANFNPKNTTTRAQFASFLNRAITTDFSDVTGAVTGAAAVKAINATTVEVSFKEAVTDINSLKFTIEGLAISNAAVKQTGDNKIVVLTTATQTGDKEYTVKSGDNTLGSFKGISAVIPAKITMNTTSTQGVVGKEVTLKADIGVKEAGVPVTFNVAADSKLNKDFIEEVTTDANGIATYSYTQYVSGESDDVVAYPTGAPAVRSLATVYWGVDTILAVTAQDEKQGNSVANGANKVYTVTSKDPKTGKPVANQKLHVTFVENVGVTIDKTSKATINGQNPMQLSNGTAAITAEVVTDSKGQATFTVSGHNTSVTPVVFPNSVVNKTDVNEWEATKLQAQAADKLVFGAVQADYVIDVTRDGLEEATVGEANGREYKVVLKTKDGKVAANEIVNVAFNEDIDRNINTITEAYFTDDDKKVMDGTKVASQITVKTDAKGEATFTISSGKDKDYATPIAWIDINTSDAKEGKFDEGEPFKVAAISYFATEKLTGGTVKAYNTADKAKEEFSAGEPAIFKFTAANQSGNKMGIPAGYTHIEATFTVFNTGADEVTVDGHVVSPNRSYTTTKVVGTSTSDPSIVVESVKNKTTSVRVVANGTAIPVSGSNNSAINLGNHEAKAEFTSTAAIGSIHTGIVQAIDTDKKTITFVGKDKVSYKDASFKNVNAVTLKENEFVKLIEDNLGKVKVTYSKVGDKVTFEIVSLDADLTSTLSAVNAAVTTAQVQAALEKSEMTPAFKDLNPAQKTLVAAEVLNLKAINGFTEVGLKNAYAAAYDSEAVVPALAAVKTTTNVTTLGNVPGLKLAAYKALGTTDASTVNSAIQGKTIATVADLQVTLDNAIAGLSTSALVNALNAATTNNDVLVALKAITDLDLTDFNDAPARVQQLVLADLALINSFTTPQQVAGKITTALTAHEDDTSVAINSLVYAAGASADTLTITFSDALDLTGLAASEIVDALGLTFKANNVLGTTATAVVSGSSNEVVTITLGAGHTMNIGAVLTGLSVKDKYKVAVKLDAVKADGKTPVTDVLDLVVKP